MRATLSDSSVVAVGLTAEKNWGIRRTAKVGSDYNTNKISRATRLFSRRDAHGLTWGVFITPEKRFDKVFGVEHA